MTAIAAARRLAAPVWTLADSVRYLILARVSTTKQDSEAQQQEKCRAYVRDVLNGEDADIDVRLDHGVSGLNEARLEEIVAECKRHPGTKDAPKFLVTFDSSRWKRVEEDHAASLRWSLKGVHWYPRSVLGFQPTGNKRVDALANTMQDGQDAAHSDMLKEKVPLGMQASAELGCWTGRPPFGYKVVGEVDGSGKRVKRTQKLVIVKEDGRTVARIFRRFAEGAMFASIAQELNAAATPGPFTRYANLGPNRVSSGKWRSCTIREILGKVAYTGAVERDGKIAKQGAHEALIDPRLWATVQTRLSHKKQPRRHTNNSQPYMLTGLLTCETCGGALVGGGGGHRSGADPTRYQVYVCPGSSKREVRTCEGRTLSVNQRWLEGTVCEHVGAQIQTAVQSGALAKELDRALGTRSDAREPRVELEKQRTALQTKQANVLDAIADGTVTKTQAKAKLEEFEAGLTGVERELSALRLVPKRSELVAERERLLKLAAKLPELLAKATPIERRELLAAWVREIRLDKVQRTGQISLRSVPAAGLLYRNDKVCRAT